MTEVFKKVQDLYPNMTMFGGGSTATPAGQSVSMDGLGNSFGVLEDYGQVTEITNGYESEQFKRTVPAYRENGIKLAMYQRIWQHAQTVEKF